MKRRPRPQKREQSAIHEPAARGPEQETQPDALQARGKCVLETALEGDAVRDEAEEGEGETCDEGADGVNCCVSRACVCRVHDQAL